MNMNGVAMVRWIYIYIYIYIYKSALMFECFPYVCPEPVLGKKIVFRYELLKKGVFPCLLQRIELHRALGRCQLQVEIDDGELQHERNTKQSRLI
jgi:hypothetical protein